MDSCPCVLEILDTAGTEQLKGQLIKLCLFLGNRGGQLSMRPGDPGYSWDGTVKETVNKTLYLFLGNRGRQLSMRPRDPGHSWNGTVKGTVNKTMSLFRKSRWTAVHAS